MSGSQKPQNSSTDCAEKALRGALWRKTWGLMVDKKLNMRQQCVQMCPGLHPESVASRLRWFFPSPLLLWDPALSIVSCSGVPNMSCWSKSRGESQSWQEDWSTPHFEDRLSKLGLLRLEKRSLHGDLTATSQKLKGTYKEAREGPFIKNYSYKTKSCRYNWKRGKLG